MVRGVWIVDEQGRKRLRDVIPLDRLHEGTARPSVVLRGLADLERSLAVAYKTKHMYKLPPLRQRREQFLNSLSESYDMALGLALSYLDEVRDHHTSVWVADALEARYVDGESWDSAAARAGISVRRAHTACDLALDWLDRRHGFVV